jgi:hypothetical protein
MQLIKGSINKLMTELKNSPIVTYPQSSEHFYELKYRLILPSHLCSGFPSGLLFSDLPTKIVSRPIHAMYPTHPALYDIAAIVKEKHQTCCTWLKS